MSWTAVYMPAGQSDRSRSGFDNEDAAWDWIHETQMCESCTRSYKEYAAGDEDAYFGCDGEWLVMKTEDYLEAGTLPDLLKAAGYKRVEKLGDL
jgi:hypothetical protein